MFKIWIRALHFGIWSGQYKTNIPNFWPKKSTKDQYNKKNSQKFFDPIPIQESFGATSQPKTNTTSKKFSWRTNTTKMAIFGGFFHPIFWPLFSKFCQNLLIFDHFFAIFWVKIFKYYLDSWNTNIDESNIV